MDLIKIGQRIKRCRREQGLTQEKLAEIIGVSTHYIYEIEHGTKTMSLYTLDNIVKCFNVPADYLLYGNISNGEYPNSDDKLSVLLEEIPLKRRNDISEIISVILPYLK